MTTKLEQQAAAASPTDAVERIKAVLSAMGITRACFVDDEFSPQETDAFAVSLRLAKSGKGDDVRSIWGAGKWSDDSEDDDRDDASRLWKDMEPDRRHEVISSLRAATGDTPERLRSLFARFWPSDACPLEERGPERFDQPYILQELVAKGPSLLFIDLSLGEDVEEGGIEILKKVRATDSEKKVICVILTAHAKADRNAEIEVWESLVSTHGIDRAAAVVISKDSAKDRAQFWPELRRAFLNALAPELFAWGRSVSKEALSALPTWSIDGDVLDAVVLRSSEREGIHPTETLFRLMDDEFRRAREAAALKSPLAGDFALIRTKLEALRQLEGKAKAEPPLSRRVKELRRIELYRDQIEVAGAPVPCGLGDLWEVEFESGVRQFVLVAQPCDIILRSKGDRSQEWALLVPIKSENGSDPVTVVELPYFDKENLNSQWLALKRARLANAKLLDLVSLRGPTIDPATIAELRELNHVHEAVSNRAKVVADWLKAALEGTVDNIPLFLDNGEPAKFSRAPVLNFHCRRAGRLDPELARLVLQRYGQFVSRYALPHDFADFK